MTCMPSEAAGPALDERGAYLPRHLYVHIPLCRSKCAYCDFYSRVDDGSIDHGALVDHTIGLLKGWLVYDWGPTPLETLYVGGGTPTVLGGRLADLISSVTELMPLSSGAEVTVEANPDSFAYESAWTLAQAGVTRVSLGVQSLDDRALQGLGRRHDASAAIEALRAASAAGLEVSADLICGVPGSDMESWEASVEGVVEAGAVHVSVYPLAAEGGTPLAEAVKAGAVTLPDEDFAADAMEAAARLLGSCGFERYEVANYALPGHYARHNVAYWTGEPYLGIGGGAHGMLDSAQARALGLSGVRPDTARVRYSYTAVPFPGVGCSALAPVEQLTQEEADREDAMLGMRMSAGISEELVESACVAHAMRSLEADGLVVHEGERWRPTHRGWLLGNEIFMRIWTAGSAA